MATTRKSSKSKAPKQTFAQVLAEREANPFYLVEDTYTTTDGEVRPCLVVARSTEGPCPDYGYIAIDDEAIAEEVAQLNEEYRAGQWR